MKTFARRLASQSRSAPLSWVAVAAMVAVLAWPPAARADSTCTDTDRAKDLRESQRAEELERSGRPGDAIKVMQTARNSECMPSAGLQRMKAVWARATRTLGEQAEKAGQFEAAHGHFLRGEHMADADRAMLRFAQANKSKAGALGRALHYFDQHGNAASAGEVRTLAEAAGKRWLQAEEKTFAGGRTASLTELEQARDFLRLLGDKAARRANERAVQRGDMMVKGNTPRALEMARDYYGFADQRDKGESVQPIAQRLGDAANKRGEYRVAEQFYELSGDNAAIESMEKSREKAEGQRQKDFKKGQDELEKELKL